MDVENKQRGKDKLGHWDWNIQTIMHHPARCLVPDPQCVVLLILLNTLADPDHYHFSSSELRGDFEFMDDANMCIAIAISFLIILICAMATYGAYKQHAAWIIPFFCYQIFDFALNTLVVVTILVYPNSIQEYTRQLPPDFPYKDDIMSVNPTCLVLIILLFISIILAFKVSMKILLNALNIIECIRECHRSRQVSVYLLSCFRFLNGFLNS